MKRDGLYLTAALPYVSEELAGWKEKRLKQAFSRISDNSLTPQAALTTLTELKALHDLEMRLAARAKQMEDTFADPAR